jgi:hypothetical protein
MRVVNAVVRVGHALALFPLLFLGTPAHAQVFVDDFNDNLIDPAVWSVSLYGSVRNSRSRIRNSSS